MPQLTVNQSPDVLIITTGGTFDKEYDEISGQLVFKGTHVPEVLSLGRCEVNTKIIELMMVDSLEMSEIDRIEIEKCCKETTIKHIVITHGTDRMVETATYLGKRNIEKTIVLTGAMIPYAFNSSDGLFNLSNSIALAQSKKPGVYISMNGKCFSWNNVHKDIHKGIFIEAKNTE